MLDDHITKPNVNSFYKKMRNTGTTVINFLLLKYRKVSLWTFSKLQKSKQNIIICGNVNVIHKLDIILKQTI